MSLFKKIFGGATSEEEARVAETLLTEGDPGSAKLRFERALSKTARSDTAARKALEARIAHCCDEIARRRLNEAKDLLATDQHRLADEELHGALEVARDESLRAELHALLDSSDSAQLLAQTAGATEEARDTSETVSLYAMMRNAEPAEADQAAEYGSYGAAFDQALQATFREDAREGVERFEALLREAKDPRYLHYELALAYRLVEDTTKARDHFETFLRRIAADEGGIARIQAHAAIASYLLDSGDADGAIEEMQKAVEALPDSPAAYHELGNLLRRCGHPTEAVEVLRAAMDLDGGDHWMMRQSLGLALIDAERTQEAQAELEQVLELFIQREDLRLPPQATEALATLFENSGQFTKAADLYRMLCDGARGEDAARLHLRAGELLLSAGKEQAADTMLKRAVALADEHRVPEVAQAATERRAALALG